MKDIRIAGTVTNSFVDWPAKIAFVIFLGGCNFTCPHCHNRKILGSLSNELLYEVVYQDIKDQIGFIDGVVISGGEPTLHPHLYEIIESIRALGLQVKLDTNGSNFDILRDLVEKKLVDYVAMDIKAPLERYAELGFVHGDGEQIKRIMENVRRSIDFLQTNGVGHMFRTTPIPELTPADFDGIRGIVGKSPYKINNYVPAD